MGAGVVHARDLGLFVEECDRLGGVAHPNAASYLSNFDLRFDTRVDETLDPFSDEYCDQQTRLHAELVGRTVTPEEGEQYRFDVAAHAAGCNPYNFPNIQFISKHTRAIHTCLVLANLPSHANILDAGAGWGLSSEAMAFCGANVTALDINPCFVELVRRRAERLSLPIKAVLSEFDSFHSDVEFDLLFFYECLHHSRKPWETLALLSRFLKPDGKIVWAGEPVNVPWWKHWGIRLDCMSAYCIRKHGWWECGWTADFLSRCFSKAGFDMTIHERIGLDNGLVGLAVRKAANVQPDLSLLAPFDELQRRHAAEVESLHRQLAAESEKSVRLAAETGELRRQLRAESEALEHVFSSRSWRVSAPLRYLAGSLRRLRASTARAAG